MLYARPLEAFSRRDDVKLDEWRLIHFSMPPFASPRGGWILGWLNARKVGNPQRIFTSGNGNQEKIAAHGVEIPHDAIERDRLACLEPPKQIRIAGPSRPSAFGEVGVRVAEDETCFLQDLVGACECSAQAVPSFAAVSLEVGLSGFQFLISLIIRFHKC